MRVLVVSGSRDPLSSSEREYVESTLGELIDGFDVAMVGDAKGVDACAYAFLRTRIPTRLFEADWKSFGNGAGPRRNQAMLGAAFALAFEALGPSDSDALLVAYPRPASKGTFDAIRRAKRMRIAVRRFPLDRIGVDLFKGGQ